jgi:CheY-like chemotaxis protein
LIAVALSGHAHPEDRERAIAAGFDAHVSKPIDPPYLVALVRELLAMARFHVAPRAMLGRPI